MPESLTAYEILWEEIQQREDYPIFRLTYLSNPAYPFTDEDFDDIEIKSILANNARDVTGLLIMHENRILQILEGRQEAVQALYTKIEADPRHFVTKMVSAVEDEERMLLTWSMVVRGVTGAPLDILEQYDRLYDELLHADQQTEITIDHIELFRAVSLFGTLPV